jgi:hypothetical protein
MVLYNYVKSVDELPQETHCLNRWDIHAMFFKKSHSPFWAVRPLTAWGAAVYCTVWAVPCSSTFRSAAAQVPDTDTYVSVVQVRGIVCRSLSHVDCTAFVLSSLQLSCVWNTWADWRKGVRPSLKTRTDGQRERWTSANGIICKVKVKLSLCFNWAPRH